MTSVGEQRGEVRDMWTRTGELTLVTSARVPLCQAEDSCLFAFRPEDGGDEVIAVRVGRVDWADSQPLVIIHHFDRVADVVGSLGAGPGPLQAAVRRLAEAGGGLLLLSPRSERWLAGLADEILTMLPASIP